jgi:carbon monoxide dehydrogenase subunit G
LEGFVDIRGSHRFQANQIQVWNALLDANFLQECIPSCEGVRWVNPNLLGFRVQLSIGPLKGTYTVVVQVQDVQPPNHVGLAFNRSGAKGSVNATGAVDFAADGDGTQVSYAVQAELGGAIAKVPGPVLESGAKVVVNQFLKRLDKKMAELPATAPAQNPV